MICLLLAAAIGGPSCAISTLGPDGVRPANAGVTTAFTPTTSFNLPPRPQDCALDLIPVGQTPSRAVLPIGPVVSRTSGAGEDREMAVIRLKERACMAGAQGLIQINTQGHGGWNDDGYYVWIMDGSATAFVYVDAAGQPLPAPAAAPVASVPPAAPQTPSPPAPAGK